MADVTLVTKEGGRHREALPGDILTHPGPNSNTLRSGEVMLGRLLGANMNSTADQTIPVGSGNYLITAIIVTNPSVSLTLAAGGVYTATAKGGSAIVAAAQVYSVLTAATVQLALTLALTTRRTETPLYLSLTTGQGVTATADVYLYGRPLD